MSKMFMFTIDDAGHFNLVIYEEVLSFEEVNVIETFALIRITDSNYEYLQMDGSFKPFPNVCKFSSLGEVAVAFQRFVVMS